MKHITQKLALAGLILGGIVSTSAQAASIIGGAMAMAPAITGSYGTYKTLNDKQPSPAWVTFAEGFKLINALSDELSVQDKNAIAEQYVRSDMDGKVFKAHETMAIFGSNYAMKLGAILMVGGIIGSLAFYYQSRKTNTEDNTKKYQKQLRTSLKVLGIGTLSFLTGAASMLLLANHAFSSSAT